jgi:hypothetical protein
MNIDGSNKCSGVHAEETEDFSRWWIGAEEQHGQSNRTIVRGVDTFVERRAREAGSLTRVKSRIGS